MFQTNDHIVPENDSSLRGPKFQRSFFLKSEASFLMNKAGYTATPVPCGLEGAVFEVTLSFGQEQYSQRIKNIKKSKV